MPRVLALCGSGFVGGFCAVLADIAIKDRASAITKLTEAARDVLKIRVPEYLVAVVFIMLAVALCVIFTPNTTADAFKLGVGVIATVMMTVPPPTTSTLSTTTKETVPYSARVGPGGFLWVGRAVAADQVPDEKTSDRKGKVLLDIVADAQSKGFSSVTITLKHAHSEEMLARSIHYFGGDQSQQRLQRAQLEFERTPGDYKLFVEVPGFVIDIQPLTIDAGATKKVEVRLEPSWIPVFFQRMWR